MAALQDGNVRNILQLQKTPNYEPNQLFTAAVENISIAQTVLVNLFRPLSATENQETCFM